MKHVIALLMENQPGALSRVVGLFSQRGYNIETLNVAPTSDPTLSRLTLSSEGDTATTNQICKHLNRLVDVAQAVNLSATGLNSCELALIKLRLNAEQRKTFKTKLQAMRAQFTDTAPDTVIVQFAGSPEEINALIAEFEQSAVIEIARSGVVSLGKAPEALEP